jgi:hypothetical protein
MCNKWNCLCKAPTNVLLEAFMEVWNANWTSKEEAYILTEPDIAGPLTELDRRQRAEKNLRRRKQWGDY